MKLFSKDKFSRLINEYIALQNKDAYTKFLAKAKEEFEDCDTLDEYYTQTFIKLGFPKVFATVEHEGKMLISKDDISNAFNGSARYVGKLVTGETVDEPVYLHNLKNGLGFEVRLWIKYKRNDYLLPSLVDKMSPLFAMFQIVSRELENGHLKFNTNDPNP